MLNLIRGGGSGGGGGTNNTVPPLPPQRPKRQPQIPMSSGNFNYGGYRGYWQGNIADTKQGECLDSQHSDILKSVVLRLFSWLKWFYRFSQTSLTHFLPLLSFYTPWKHQKI